MSFLAELRRRKVFQVALGYLAVAWLLVQVTATILPAFDLPTWALRFIVLLFALGFPIAVLMAWALELTPEGIKLDVSTSGGKGMLAIAAALMAVALGWFFRGHVLSTQPVAQVAQTSVTEAVSQQPKADERSIAVLPLVNASNDNEEQFFSDGLSENLIDTLSRFDGLKVIGRMSSFQFRDDKGDSAAIGAKLGAAYLLSGSVQRAGDLVRISASLVKAADGRTLWAQHYDRPYKDLFALQDEIAQAVAGALQVKLLSTSAAAKQDDRPPSGSLEAYNAYLQGLKFWHDENFAEAAEYMDKAVQLDPGYAMAWALLSGSRSTVATFWNEPPAIARQHMKVARLAADKALQLAPGMGAAHAARAYLQIYSFDHRDALAECRRAVQLAPGDGTVLNGCGYVVAQAGKLGEAIRSREHLLSIEPLYIINYQQYARLLMATGHLDEAEKYLRTAESLLQTNPTWHFRTILLRLTAALMRGDAGAAMDNAMQLPAEDRVLYTAMASQVAPDRAAANAALANVLANKTVANADPYSVAQIYALRGDAGHAVEWLRRTSPGGLVFLPLDPLILNVRDDPRFIAFCEKTGLPSPSENEALSIDQVRALLSNPQPRS
jgi:TolB-like protein/Tfp pilus assembly protein PilF